MQTMGESMGIHPKKMFNLMLDDIEYMLMANPHALGTLGYRYATARQVMDRNGDFSVISPLIPQIDASVLHRTDRTKSGYVGVYSNGKGFSAQGRGSKGERSVHLGTFQSAEEAAWARRAHYLRHGFTYGKLAEMAEQYEKRPDRVRDLPEASVKALLISESALVNEPIDGLTEEEMKWLEVDVAALLAGNPSHRKEEEKKVAELGLPRFIGPAEHRQTVRDKSILEAEAKMNAEELAEFRALREDLARREKLVSDRYDAHHAALAVQAAEEAARKAALPPAPPPRTAPPIAAPHKPRIDAETDAEKIAKFKALQGKYRAEREDPSLKKPRHLADEDTSPLTLEESIEFGVERAEIEATFHLTPTQYDEVVKRLVTEAATEAAVENYEAAVAEASRTS